VVLIRLRATEGLERLRIALLTRFRNGCMLHFARERFGRSLSVGQGSPRYLLFSLNSGVVTMKIQVSWLP